MIEQLKINVLGSYHVTNCYIIWDKDSKEAAVIDPADDVSKIENCINMLGLNLKYSRYFFCKLSICYLNS